VSSNSCARASPLKFPLSKKFLMNVRAALGSEVGRNGRRRNGVSSAVRSAEFELACVTQIPEAEENAEHPPPPVSQKALCIIDNGNDKYMEFSEPYLWTSIPPYSPSPIPGSLLAPRWCASTHRSMFVSSGPRSSSPPDLPSSSMPWSGHLCPSSAKRNSAWWWMQIADRKVVGVEGVADHKILKVYMKYIRFCRCGCACGAESRVR
jgi:hypothetical protein